LAETQEDLQVQINTMHTSRLNLSEGIYRIRNDVIPLGGEDIVAPEMCHECAVPRHSPIIELIVAADAAAASTQLRPWPEMPQHYFVVSSELVLKCLKEIDTEILCRSGHRGNK
jgi:hypothetical protein